jgi:NAD(P)-dependent dehydrogenase (short-subunit alcohol dehydrogenase family)
MGCLWGKVIAITGVASGIGLALSQWAGTDGAKLALADIQDESLEKIIRKKSPQYKEHPVEPKRENSTIGSRRVEGCKRWRSPNHPGRNLKPSS